MNRRTRASSLCQLAFLHHPLVRLAHALDAVLQLAALVRKLADDLVIAFSRRPIGKAAGEAHRLSRSKIACHVCSDRWCFAIKRDAHRLKRRRAIKQAASPGKHARQTCGRTAWIAQDVATPTSP